MFDFSFLQLSILLGPLKLSGMEAPERLSFKMHSPLC